MKKLPLGTQSFENLRKEDFVYVDKTEIIHGLISEGRIYFFSRPRRFGKSLLISTLDALFSGRKELFEGLYIYDKWDWSQQYPVIRIDWTQINHSTPEKMEIGMIEYLNDIAQDYQLTLDSQSASGCFRRLIKFLYNKTNETKVVILIDEYDKPITEHLFDSNLETIRSAVHDFYQVMKGADQYIEFIFITGVSKFSSLSIFSALNNTTDITLRKRYASLCGYTQEELENNFSEYIDSAAEYLEMSRGDLLKQIRYWYNGYTWDGKTSVYNPFSTMHFFDEQEFSNYWFATGTPTFLIEIIKRRNNPNMVLEDINVSEDVFNEYDPLNISEIPLLFQTGYLTIKQKERMNLDLRYTLGMPNMEVTQAFMKCLLEAFGKYSKMDIDNLRITLEGQIIACDEIGFTRTLNSMLGTIPFEIDGKINEAYYHGLMLMWMRMLGFDIHGEVSNNIGRADAVWKQPGLTVVAEIKFDNDKPIDTHLNAAMKQIHDRQYYNRYLGKILLLGIAFSGKKAGCKMEVIS